MNKKGRIGGFYWIFVLIIGLFIFGGGYMVIDDKYLFVACDEACINLDMEVSIYYREIDRLDYCIDSEGIAHEAIFRCKGFAWNKQCKANLVSVD